MNSTITNDFRKQREGVKNEDESDNKGKRNGMVNAKGVKHPRTDAKEDKTA